MAPWWLLPAGILVTLALAGSASIGRIKGIPELVRQVPQLKKPGTGVLLGLWVPLAVWLMLSGAMLVTSLTDAYGPLVAEAALLLLSAGLLWSRTLWARTRLRQAHGDAAASRAFRWVPVGGPALAAALIYPGLAGPWHWRPAATLGAYLTGTCVLLMRGVLLTAGVPRALGTHYFEPDQARRITPFDALMRHPVYSALVRAPLGLGLLAGGAMAVGAGVLGSLGVLLVLREDGPGWPLRTGLGLFTELSRPLAFWQALVRDGLLR